MDLSRVEIDGVNRLLLFHGDCNEMRPVCRAMCCRAWELGITAEEYTSGQYQAEVVCTLTMKACIDTNPPCPSRRYRLAKQADKSCIYLEEDLCSIYARRPAICHNFQCQGGWRLDTVIHPESDSAPDQGPAMLSQETFVERINSDEVFILHPLIKVNTVFYRKSKHEIIFIKEMAGPCGKFTTYDSFDHPQLDDTQLLKLIDLFARKKPLGEIYARFCAQNASALTLPEFYALVWLLNKHNIVIDSRNFQGMLSGMGAI
jgi:hypothetical protein